MDEVTVMHSVVTKDTGSTEIGNGNPDILGFGGDKGACPGKRDREIWWNCPVVT
jgi:hypothetical protein